MALTPEQKKEKRRREIEKLRVQTDPILAEKKAEAEKERFRKQAEKEKLGARKYKKTSERTSARKTLYKVEERERIRTLLVGHFGASAVDKATIKCLKMTELDEAYKTLKHRMEKELEAKQLEVQKYYEQIDKDYRRVGRPNSEFNWRECEYLCSIGCTTVEIAGFFRIDPSTLRDKVKAEYGITFNEYYERQSQGIKVALRRAQINAALKGDIQMQKFLGKNMLGQKEKVDFEGEVKVNSWVDLVKTLETEGDGALSSVLNEQEGDKNEV